jgi:hypothetical protein
MKSNYRDQLYAMEAAIDQLQGTMEPLGSLKAAFLFYGGDSARFSYYLDRMLENRKDVQIVYDRVPGWYTTVLVKIARTSKET